MHKRRSLAQLADIPIGEERILADRRIRPDIASIRLTRCHCHRSYTLGGLSQHDAKVDSVRCSGWLTPAVKHRIVEGEAVDLVEAALGIDRRYFRYCLQHNWHAVLVGLSNAPVEEGSRYAALQEGFMR